MIKIILYIYEPYILLIKKLLNYAISYILNLNHFYYTVNKKDIILKF